MGTREQVARDYGVEFARAEGDAAVVALWEGIGGWHPGLPGCSAP